MRSPAELLKGIAVILVFVSTVLFGAHKVIDWKRMKNSAEFTVAMQLINERRPDWDKSAVTLVSYSRSRHYKDSGFETLVLVFSSDGSDREEVMFRRVNDSDKWTIPE